MPIGAERLCLEEIIGSLIHHLGICAFRNRLCIVGIAQKHDVDAVSFSGSLQDCHLSIDDIRILHRRNGVRIWIWIQFSECSLKHCNHVLFSTGYRIHYIISVRVDESHIAADEV